MIKRQTPGEWVYEQCQRSTGPWPPPTDANTLTLAKLEAAASQFDQLDPSHRRVLEVCEKIRDAKYVDIRITEYAINGDIMVIDQGCTTIFGVVPGEGVMVVAHPDQEQLVRGFVDEARGTRR